MRIAFIGSHGTGKTTTIKKIQSLRKDWIYLTESTRHIVPLLGFNNAYEIVEKYGIAFYEGIIMGQWCIIDHNYNSFYDLSDDDIMIIDRSPLDNLAYYYILREKFEHKHEFLLKKIADYYLTFIDYYIFFPIGIFDFEPDQMQKKSKQKEHNDSLLRLIKDYHINNIYCINEKTINCRALEAIEIVKKLTT